MVYFVGAGTGAADLITVRGMRLLERADVIIYAGSLVNPELLAYAGKTCEIHNSAKLTLDEVIEIMKEADKQGKMIVRLHTGGNRWTNSTGWELLMRAVPVSVPALVLQHHSIWNTRFRVCPSP